MYLKAKYLRLSRLFRTKAGEPKCMQLLGEVHNAIEHLVRRFYIQYYYYYCDYNYITTLPPPPQLFAKTLHTLWRTT